MYIFTSVFELKEIVRESMTWQYGSDEISAVEIHTLLTVLLPASLPLALVFFAGHGLIGTTISY